MLSTFLLAYSLRVFQSQLPSDEETGSTGSSSQVEIEENPAVKKCRVSRLLALTQDRLMGVPISSQLRLTVSMAAEYMP